MAQDTSFQNPAAEDIHLILRDFLKVIKVISMYPPDNPMPQSLQQSFAERLVDLVDEHQGLKFQIEKGVVLWNGETVYEDTSREDALAAIFFNAGITLLQFAPGLNWDDVKALLAVVRRHQNKEQTARDLASAMWEANLNGVTYKTIEDVALAEFDGSFKVQEFTDLSSTDRDIKADPNAAAMYESLFVGVDYDEDESGPDYEADTFTGRRLESGDLALDTNPGRSTADRQPTRLPGDQDLAVGEADESEDNAFGGVDASVFFELGDEIKGVEPATRAMGLEDVRPTALDKVKTTRLIASELAPSAEDKAALDDMLYRDAAFDMVESTTELLKEMLHQEHNLNAFAETVTICERLLGIYLKNGLIASATDLIGYLRIHQDTLRQKSPQWAARIDETMTTIASRDRLGGLVDGLNAYEQIEAEQLAAFLHCFDWQAIVGISEILTLLTHSHHRQAITDFLASKGSAHLNIVARNLQSGDPEIVANAVLVLGRIGTREAVAHLEKATRHRQADIRLAAAEALETCDGEETIALLATLAQDREADVRAAAVAALVQRRGPQAFDAIAGVLDTEQFDQLTNEEQQSLLVAYSLLGGDHAVDYLVDLATKANPFGDKKLKALRGAAFTALAHNRSDKCEKVLLKLTSSWRPDLKQQAIDALQLRRDKLFGDGA